MVRHIRCTFFYSLFCFLILSQRIFSNYFFLLVNFFFLNFFFEFYLFLFVSFWAVVLHLTLFIYLFLKGRIVSYLCPRMEKYSSWKGHSDEVRAIATNDVGVLSLSATSLRFCSKGGYTHLSYQCVSPAL